MDAYTSAMPTILYLTALVGVSVAVALKFSKLYIAGRYRAAVALAAVYLAAVAVTTAARIAWWQ